MIYKNIEIHNCVQMQYNEETKLYKMCRIPLKLNEEISGNGFCNTGVELRFVPVDDEVKITLKAASGTVTRPLVYYGSIQSGWQNLYKDVYDFPTEIIIPKSKNHDFLKQVTKENSLPFSSEMVRVILANAETEIGNITGNCRPPESFEKPQKAYLAYGSSITHGSLAMVQPNTYASRVGEHFKADVINLGFAGNAKLESSVAEYIANECEFDFATLEMGINILDIGSDEYEKKVRNFVSKVAKAHPHQKIFCIDVFYMNLDLTQRDVPDSKPAQFRRILRNVISELGLLNVVYINGLDLLSGAWGLSEDGVHPNARGVEEIAARLTKIIAEHLKNFR